MALSMPPKKKKLSNNIQVAAAMIGGYICFEALLYLSPHDPHVWSVHLIKHAFYGVMIFCCIFALDYYANNFFGKYKLNSQQVTHRERMWNALGALHRAEVELRRANVEYDQPNIQRALAQAEKAIEVTKRHMERLHREVVEGKKVC